MSEEALSEAQKILDQIVIINLSSLFEKRDNKEQHLSEIKLAQQKLRAVKKEIDRFRGMVSANLGRSQADTQVKHIMNEPFNLLEKLLDALNINLKELENAIKFDSAYPPPLKFGEVLIADQQGTPKLVTREEAKHYYAQLRELEAQQQARKQQLALERQKASQRTLRIMGILGGASVFACCGCSCFIFILGSI